MDNMELKLRELREYGHIITTPLFSITYNIFRDSFFIDIPENRKVVCLAVDGFDDVIYWDLSDEYPHEVPMSEDGDYFSVWMEIEKFAYGGNLNLLPSTIRGGEVMIRLNTGQDEEIEVPMEKIKIVKNNYLKMMEDMEYKRKDRSVNQMTRNKISQSLKSYYATHPRTKAKDGGEWSRKISDGLKFKYWSRIPKRKSDGEMIADGDIV